MLGFLDNGFFIFLIIALLSAVSEWLTKRRASKEGDPTLSPPRRPDPRPDGNQPDPAREVRAPGRRKPSSLFEQLEKELRKLTDDGPVVEVLDEPSRKPERQQGRSAQSPVIVETDVPQISDPVQAQHRKLAEMERRKQEAAQQLKEAQRKAPQVRKQPVSSGSTTPFTGFGTDTRQIRQWVRDRDKLRSAIVLNTLLETPKGLQAPESEQTAR